MKRSSISSAIYILLLKIVLFSSCEKVELPVQPHDPGDVITASVNMQEDYTLQIFYDLKTNRIVSQNLKTAWDLAFENSQDGYHVLLNSSKMMYAYNTGKKDFDAVTTKDTTGNKKWDTPDGDLDNTAIGDWRQNRNVYIIDRGINSTGTRLGLWKIQFIDVNAGRYEVWIAPVSSGETSAVTITKDTTYNLSFLSFEDKKQLMIEPPKNTWDIVFTQYMHIFTEPLMPYLVTGCLLNRNATTAAVDTVREFQSIDISCIKTYSFTNNINTIGYSWKAFTGNTYVTYPAMNYIIQNHEGIYYKLHFIDFMAAGVKGNPKWEYQQL